VIGGKTEWDSRLRLSHYSPTLRQNWRASRIAARRFAA
jgi:hypothetical protein